MFTWLKNKLTGSDAKPIASARSGSAAVAWVPAPGTVATTEYQKQGDIFLNAGRLQEAAHCYRQLLILDDSNAAAHHQLGDIHIALKETTQAESCYRRALKITPDAGDTLYSLGLLLGQKNYFTEAEACYRKALKTMPDDANAHYHLSLSLQSQSRWQESEGSCRKALDIAPDFSEAHAHLAALLLQLSRPGEAEASCRKALQLNPDLASAHFSLGMLAHQHGRLADAEAAYRQALALQTGHHGALDYLSALLQGQGRYAETETAYLTAAANNPGDATPLCKLASMQMDFGKLQDAERNLRKAINIQPDYADAIGTLGILLINRGQYQEADARFHQVLQIRPNDAVAFDNLGLILYLQGRFNEAIEFFQKAIQHNPEFVNSHNNLGSAYKQLGRRQDAKASYQHVLRLQPESDTAHNNLGLVYADMGEIDQAESMYRKALALNPDFAEAHTNLLFVLNYHPKLSGAEVYAAYEDYERKFAQRYQREWRSFDNPRQPGKRLKIAYVSPDMRSHSIRHFLEPLLKRHDKNVVEIYAYAHLNWEDAVTARYKTYVDHWVPTLHLSDEALAARIRADGIDIAIDLASHTGNSRLLMFARKPAPVSVSWLGYAYTTGVKAIDYMLMDSTSMPPGSEAVFAEKPWRIDTPGYVYRPAENMGEVSPLPALQNKHLTFGCLSRSIRINDKVIAVWARILNQVTDARLIIDSNNFNELSMQEAYITKFATHGIDSSRLEIGFHSPPWDVMRKIDIGLDCFPHNSGTTLFESLYMGIPYVTLASRPSMGLLGSSILEGAGHPEWIARTEQEYIDKAVALASDLTGLAQLRMGLREQTKASPLMDETGFARKMEAAYRGMWKKWCEQNPE